MQDCNKCGKKIKTLYERFGASGKFEAVGYHCKRCNIFYNKDLKNAESQPAHTVYKSERNCIQFRAEPYTEKASLGLAVPATTAMRKAGPEGFDPTTCGSEDRRDILTTLRAP